VSFLSGTRAQISATGQSTAVCNRTTTKIVAHSRYDLVADFVTDMCESTTWTKTATTTSCATCSISVQKARARHVDVGLTQGSWSLQCEHVTSLSVTSLDILLHLLHARHPLKIYCVAPNRRPIWFASIMALRYPSYSPSKPFFVRDLLLVGATVLDWPARGKQITNSSSAVGGINP
jgi:hypothetical protein